MLIEWRVGSKTSDAQLAAFAAKPSFRKLMRLDVRGADVVAYLGAEHQIWINPRLRPGRYVMYDQSLSARSGLGTLYRSHLRVVTVS